MMTKPIKFDLILDGKQIRDIEGLEDNFNIDDLLAHYRSGLLQRWLNVRQFSDLSAKVENIKEKGDHAVARSLITAFEISSDKQEIESAIYHIRLRKQETEQQHHFQANQSKRQKIIANYHKDYERLCEQLILKKDDYDIIRSTLQNIHKDFLGQFKLNFSELYYKLIEKAPLSVLGFLANENLRNYLLFHSEIKDHITDRISKSLPDIGRDLSTYIFEYVEEFRKTGAVQNLELYNFIPNTFIKAKKKKLDTKKIDFMGNHEIVIINSDPMTLYGEPLPGKILGISNPLVRRITNFSGRLEIVYTTIPNIKKMLNISSRFSNSSELIRFVKTFAGKTESYWKDIEPKGKKFMVINMEEGNCIRNTGNHGQELAAKDVNGNFPILDGIDYKSNSADHILFYMKV